LLASRRVLVVDDEQHVREIARSMLAELGYEVAVAENGEAALRELEASGDIALLFTDCMMPGRLDGPALAVEARKLSAKLPVLFTSGVQGRVVTGQGDRDIAFLAKPYTAEQLDIAIRSL